MRFRDNGAIARKSLRLTSVGEERRAGDRQRDAELH
jgi:hypothetical protein